jgi:hypothetical protein
MMFEGILRPCAGLSDLLSEREHLMRNIPNEQDPQHKALMGLRLMLLEGKLKEMGLL